MGIVLDDYQDCDGNPVSFDKLCGIDGYIVRQLDTVCLETDFYLCLASMERTTLERADDSDDENRRGSSQRHHDENPGDKVDLCVTNFADHDDTGLFQDLARTF